jgi:hypothetical protein
MSVDDKRRGGGWLRLVGALRPSAAPAGPRREPPPLIAPPAVSEPPQRPPFSPHNELERLFMAAADTPSSRPAFIRAVLEAELFAVTEKQTPQTGVRVLGPSQSVRFAGVPLKNGEKAFLLYTAPERVFQVFGEGAPFIRMRGRPLLDWVRADHVLLNYGLDYVVMWSPKELDAMLDQG